MKLNIARVTSLLAPLASALPTVGPAVQADYDAIVVGGGPAGLAAASALGRVRRNVLLVDSGEYRNEVTRHVHDVLGFDGVTPAYFRFRARQQISEYDTVTFTNGTVDAIESRGNSSVTYFTMSAKIGSEYTSSTITARKVILATGIRDIIPNTPGLAENFGKGIYWCPWCDGHEHEDQPIGVLGSLDVSANTPLEILSLNKNIILFVNGTDTPENRAIADKKLPDWDEWLQINAIKIENRTITALERLRDGTNNSDPSRATNPEHDLFRVHFSSGDPIERAAFMTNFKSEQKSNLGANTGVALYGGRLAANVSKGMESNIPGIYSVGDANSDNSTNVPHAMWSAKRAVVSLHVALETENAKAQVAGLTKRDLGLEDLQTLWRRINGPDDFLDAGEFDQ